MERKLKAEKEDEERRMQHELQIEKLKSETSLEQSKHEGTMLERTSRPKPKIPFFVEKVNEMDSYLERFEWVAEGCGWEKGDWPYQLSQYLRGKATEAYTRLSTADRKDYNEVKNALFKRFDLTQEGYRKKPRESKAYDDETPLQIYTRLRSCLDKWIQLSEGKELSSLLWNSLYRHAQKISPFISSRQLMKRVKIYATQLHYSYMLMARSWLNQRK